jgi:RNA polymerase-binding transcription factor DksA
MATARRSTKAAPTVKKTPAPRPAVKSTKARASATRRAKPTSRTTAGSKTASKSAPAKKTASKATVKATVTKSTATKTASTSKKAAASRQTAPAAPTPTIPPATVNGTVSAHLDLPAPKGVTKDGIAYTKDFDARFLKAQRDLLTAERVALVGQADRLEDEAHQLIEDGEMGDVQFDDESGEGDTMVVERERDLALSAQARQTVADIDAALQRIAAGSYGYSLVSGKPIPRERLEAIPWATELVEEKVGGIGRR